MKLRELLNTILHNYPDNRAERADIKFRHNQLAEQLRHGLRTIDCYHNLLKDYESQGSAGEGQWSILPWIAIYDPELTLSPQSGYYLVYLFDDQMQHAYLSLNHGWTYYRKHYNDPQVVVDTINHYWQKTLTPTLPTISSEPITLITTKKDNDARLGNELCNIFSITYAKDALPDNEQLLTDLQAMLTLFKQLKAQLQTPINDIDKNTKLILQK